jgi:hypothetical protein
MADYEVVLLNTNMPGSDGSKYAADSTLNYPAAHLTGRINPS